MTLSATVADRVSTGTRRSPLTREKVIERIRRWDALYGEPPGTADWNPSVARWRAQEWRVARYRLGDPETGEPWPSTTAAKRRFAGSWDAAVRAAGFEPRKPGPRPAGLPTHLRAVTPAAGLGAHGSPIGLAVTERDAIVAGAAVEGGAGAAGQAVDRAGVAGSAVEGGAGAAGQAVDRAGVAGSAGGGAGGPGAAVEGAGSAGGAVGRAGSAGEGAGAAGPAGGGGRTGAAPCPRGPAVAGVPLERRAERARQDAIAARVRAKRSVEQARRAKAARDREHERRLLAEAEAARLRGELAAARADLAHVSRAASAVAARAPASDEGLGGPAVMAAALTRLADVRRRGDRVGLIAALASVERAAEGWRARL